MDWFEKLVGFKEGRYHEVKKRISIIDDDVLLIDGKEYYCGHFEVKKLSELRCESLSGGSVKELVGDVGELHKLHPNSVFQVASQFNCLEMYHPGVSKYDGVTRYQDDPTQGPCCAIACGIGTIYRNYFTDVNTLDSFSSELWKFENGYIFPYREKEPCLEFLDLENLKFGIHWDVPVSETNHNVAQVFCSALPISYIGRNTNFLDKFAKQILIAAYEASFFVAYENFKRTGNNKLFLTKLGGGAFGNNPEWIYESIEYCLDRYRGLDVSIISYGRPDPQIQKTLDKYLIS